jgi:hypothetical protein
VIKDFAASLLMSLIIAFLIGLVSSSHLRDMIRNRCKNWKFWVKDKMDVKGKSPVSVAETVPFTLDVDVDGGHLEVYDDPELAMAITLSKEHGGEDDDTALAMALSLSEMSMQNSLGPSTVPDSSHSSSSSSSLISLISSSSSSSSVVVDGNECAICFSDMSTMNKKSLRGENSCSAYMLLCHHVFCSKCLGEHITRNVLEKRFRISCPLCAECISHTDIRELSTQNIFTQWIEGSTQMFLEENLAKFFHCPTRDCPNIQEIVQGSSAVTCGKCGKEYCLTCRKEHAGQCSFASTERSTFQETLANATTEETLATEKRGTRGSKKNTITTESSFPCPTGNCSYMLSPEQYKWWHSLLEPFFCPSKEYFTVVCNGCRTTYCFKCGEQHEGDCTLYKKWKNLNRSGDILFQKTAIDCGYKQCPNCCRYIEKNGGCQQMMCKCGKEFNWKAVTFQKSDIKT